MARSLAKLPWFRFAASVGVLTCLGCPDKQLSPDNDHSLDGKRTERVDPPEASVYIRASFDDDPSSMIGLFFKEGADPSTLDENAGFKLRCSSFVRTKIVNNNQSVELTYNASQNVMASLGVKPFGKASYDDTMQAGLLVKYKLTRKMVAEVEDIDGFARCCDAAPGECSELMVGEYLFGTGEMSQFAGSEKDVKANADYKVASADFSFNRAKGWKRVTSFENVYFAFRTRAGRPKDKTCDTDGWTRQVPSSLDGKFFVGVSSRSGSEAKARELAMLDARRQVVKFLGQAISETYKGRSTVIEDIVEDETLVAAGAAAVAERVKDRCWAAPVLTRTSEGPLTEVSVLAYFPEAELLAAQKAAVEAMAKQAEADGKSAKGKQLRDIQKTLSPR